MFMVIVSICLAEFEQSTASLLTRTCYRIDSLAKDVIQAVRMHDQTCDEDIIYAHCQVMGWTFDQVLSPS